MTAALAGFVLGVVSSVHCAAMCGPLMAIVRQTSSGRTWRGVALYHAGRILMYATFGVLAGTLGAGISMSGFGRALSIAGGVVLLVMAAGSLPRWRSAATGGPGLAMGRLWARVRQATSRLGPAGAFAAGMANAFLPCGLLVVALVGAAAIGDVSEAAISMMAFGLGTTPSIVAIWWSLGSGRRLRPAHAALLTPAVLVITGLLLIARGLGTAGHTDAHETTSATASAHSH